MNGSVGLVSTKPFFKYKLSVFSYFINLLLSTLILNIFNDLKPLYYESIFNNVKVYT